MKSVKNNTISIKLLVLVVCAAINSFSMAFHAPSPVFSFDARLNCPVITERGGTAYLQITVHAPNIPGDAGRKPMNLSVVIDRSGSMSDQHKMEYVKKAFSTLIDQLQPYDILSQVIYDDVVEILRHSQRIGNDRQSIKRMLDNIYPRGSTNLGGGLMEGLRQSEQFVGKEYINRVILLSDGLANVGVTDPHELSRIARQYRNRSISITAMGVGLDYNENLMMGISESGGGNYYFIEHPNSLASIVHQEFDIVSSVVAQNASISLTLGNNVHMQDAVGCEYRNEGGHYNIPIGDLYANESREITIELTIPEGTGKKVVATGELRYESSTIIAPYPKFVTTVRYTKDFAEVEQHRDMGSQAKSDIAVSARKVEQAMQAMDKGDRAEAEIRLNEAKDLITKSPAASATGASGESVRTQLGKIESYQKTAQDEDSQKAKKSIQYDNYKTRKNK